MIFPRYLGVSALALAGDSAGLALLLGLGMARGAAAALAYLAGVVLHWALSARLVFASAQGAARWRQKALFLGSALAGLGITTGLVSMLGAAGVDVAIAKLVAVAVSFTATYLLRRCFVFGQPA